MRLALGTSRSRRAKWNRNEMNPVFPGEYTIVDVVAVERQARAMQSKVMAELLRAGWRRVKWLAAPRPGRTNRLTSWFSWPPARALRHQRGAFAHCAGQVRLSIRNPRVTCPTKPPTARSSGFALKARRKRSGTVSPGSTLMSWCSTAAPKRSRPGHSPCLEDADRRPLGLVTVNTNSKIVARMLDRDPTADIDQAWLKERHRPRLIVARKTV
jgi:hypothetical protein